jgi:hypothetical protein
MNSLSLSLQRVAGQPIAYTLSLSLSITHTHSLSLQRVAGQPIACTLSLSLSITHTHTLSLQRVAGQPIAYTLPAVATHHHSFTLPAVAATMLVWTAASASADAHPRTIAPSKKWFYFWSKTLVGSLYFWSRYIEGSRQCRSLYQCACMVYACAGLTARSPTSRDLIGCILVATRAVLEFYIDIYLYCSSTKVSWHVHPLLIPSIQLCQPLLDCIRLVVHDRGSASSQKKSWIPV